MRSLPIEQASATRMHELPMVYVLRTQDFEFIKVGRTKDFKSRLNNVQSGCPFDLYLWCAIYTPESAVVEADLHRSLSHAHLRGEWFKPGDSDLDLILDFCQKRNRLEKARHALLQA